MGWRPLVAAIGRVFMAAGALLLLFVAYELWGTGIAEARHQSALKKDFRAIQLAPPVTVPDESAPPPPTGTAIAIIKIPRLNEEKAVVQGVGVEDLKKGPGHYPQTPLPGQPGNAAIAGHRTTYGAPFYNLDQLQPGDPILITTLQGRFRYEVVTTKIVRPSDVAVLNPTTDNELTLTTCNPRFSASQRMVVSAHLVGPAAEAGPKPVPTPPGTSLSLDDEAGLSGAQAARWPAIAWGAGFFGLWLAAALVGRRLGRKWLVYAVAALPMAVTLFVFFENIARLLPANV